MRFGSKFKPIKTIPLIIVLFQFFKFFKQINCFNFQQIKKREKKREENYDTVRSVSPKNLEILIVDSKLERFRILRKNMYEIELNALASYDENCKNIQFSDI